MTREEFAHRVKWPMVIWFFGLVNPLFMLPQLVKIWESESASSISLFTLLILFTLQTVFGIHGFIIRQTIFVVSNTLGALMTIATAVSALYFGAS